MATVVQTNADEVFKSLVVDLKGLGAEKVIRPVMFGLMDKMHERIHVDGKAASDQPIGTYSASYLQLRKRKNAPEGKKIVVILTGDLERDWHVIEIDNGFGVGFQNEFSFQKAEWVEAQTGKTIFAMTQNELKYVEDLIDTRIDEILNGK